MCNTEDGRWEIVVYSVQSYKCGISQAPTRSEKPDLYRPQVITLGWGGEGDGNKLLATFTFI